MTIEELQREIAALREELAPKRRQLMLLEEELTRMEIEEFFERFPEKRLAVDDKILVTDEFNQLMEKRDTWGSPVNTEGKIFWVYDTQSVRVETKGGTVTIPFNLALRMRQAYLAQEATE